jgi:hypothetical protein
MTVDWVETLTGAWFRRCFHWERLRKYTALFPNPMPFPYMYSDGVIHTPWLECLRHTGAVARKLNVWNGIHPPRVLGIVLQLSSSLHMDDDAYQHLHSRIRIVPWSGIQRDRDRQCTGPSTLCQNPASAPSAVPYITLRTLRIPFSSVSIQIPFFTNETLLDLIVIHFKTLRIWHSSYISWFFGMHVCDGMRPSRKYCTTVLSRPTSHLTRRSPGPTTTKLGLNSKLRVYFGRFMEPCAFSRSLIKNTLLQSPGFVTCYKIKNCSVHSRRIRFTWIIGWNSTILRSNEYQ